MPRVAHSRGANWGEFPPDFVADLLRFTLEVWADFALPRSVYKETRITALFSRLLEERVYGDQTKDWAVVDETKQYDRHGKEIARTDIRVLPPGKKRRDFAFVFECKRLNVHRRGRVHHGAGAYVGKDGMMCFVTGKYASGLRKGGMLAYVMDGDVASAREAVSRFIDRRRLPLRLGLLTGYVPCGLLGNHLPHGETRHDLADGRTFTLYHLLVPVRRNR
jgi:hypothetical protein